MAKGWPDDRGKGKSGGQDPDAGLADVERQRIDKWLWFARVVKTRALAADLVTAGHVRINGRRSTAPGKAIRTGDVLTIALDRTIRVLRVRAAGSRRGPYEEARLLYEDLSPAATAIEPTDEPED